MRGETKYWQDCYETALKQITDGWSNDGTCPVDEFNQLSNYYQGKITEGALLDKAGRLAAEQQLILEDKNIPDSMAFQTLRPMALQQGRLVKRVRTVTAAPSQYTGVEEPERMAEAPTETVKRNYKRRSTTSNHPNYRRHACEKS